MLKVIKALGLKRNQFAEGIALGKSLISGICNGQKEIQAYQFLLFEKVYGANSEFIKGNSDDMFISSNVEGASEKNQNPKQKKENPEIPEITQVLRSQVDDLRKHNEFLSEAIEGLQEDKKRLIEENTELKKEMDSMEKRQANG